MKLIPVLLAVAGLTLFSAGTAWAADPAKDACNGAAAIEKERDKARTSSEKAQTESEYQAETAACYEVEAEALRICPVEPKSLNKECIKEFQKEVKICLEGAKAGKKANQQGDKAQSQARKEATNEAKKECLNGINI